MKKIFILCLTQALLTMPVLALDFDSTVNDSSRKNYSTAKPTETTKTVPVQKEVLPQSSTFKQIEVNNTKQEQIIAPEPTPAVLTTPVVEQKAVTTPIIQKTTLPSVPALPSKAFSSTVAPLNLQYSGKCPNSDAIIPCNDIKVSDLIIDETVVKSKVKTATSTKETKSKTDVKTVVKSQPKYRTVQLAKGTQIRMVNSTKITDYMCAGQTIVFRSTQEIHTPYFKIPAKTKFTAKVIDSHRPQLSCNGGLVAFRIVSAEINGYNQPINAGIIKIKTDRVHFSNLKGNHTYWKTTCKKAKWGQKKFSQWSKTASRLADNGPAIILSPFPYLGGCVAACASTLTSPVTALLGKGGSLIIPANTTFTVKLYDDAKIRY
ncbi:MAG: hypothetical protein NC200_02235 [Candidatus Gastranaerophilales bacterium]|nr:hypothetical protein [Candidatus Gastranaerophilales bacterium]